MPFILTSKAVAALIAGTATAQAFAAAPQWTQELAPAVSLAGAPKRHFALAERMAHYHVPAVSVAVVDHCRIAETFALGLRTNGGPRVTAETQFQAASISKAVTAVAALRMVEAGRLALDADVRNAVPGWHATGRGADSPVTLRQLLSHSAGASGHGFEGYSKGKPLPMMAQILNGLPPANNKRITIEVKPGTKFQYSGGGYTLVQALMTERGGSGFPSLMDSLLLRPLGMAHSAFGEPRGGGDVALGHDKGGQAIPGGWNIYPELAAAGLWSTPTDLARFTIALMEANRGEAATPILDRKTVQEMLTPQNGGPWGLGFELRSKDGHRVFMHTGENVGYLSILVGFPATCSGVVTMVNGEGGSGLMKEVVLAISRERGWPAIIQSTQVRPLDAAQAQRLAGHYVVAEPAFAFDIKTRGAEGPQLFLGGASKGRIVADMSARLLVVGPDLNPLAALKTNEDGTITVLLGGRSYLARKSEVR